MARALKTMFVSVFYDSDQWYQILGSIVKPLLDVYRVKGDVAILMTFDSTRGDSLNLSCFSDDRALLETMLIQFTQECKGYIGQHPSCSKFRDNESSLFCNFENNRIYYKVNPFTPYFFTPKDGKFLPSIWQKISELLIAEVIDSQLNRENLRTMYLYILSVLLKIEAELFNEFIKQGHDKGGNFESIQFEETYRRMYPTLEAIENDAASLSEQVLDVSNEENSILGIAKQVSVFVSEIRELYDSPSYWLRPVYSYILLGMQKSLGLTDGEAAICLQLLYRIKRASIIQL